MISVIIVTYNEENNIKECLDSLIDQSKKPDEVILVDDGSTDKTNEITSTYPVKIIKIDRKERSHARNIGWKDAKGNIILFAEADSVFDKDWIKEIINKFNQGADAVIDRRKMYQPKTFFQKTMDIQFDIRYGNYKPFTAWAFKKEVLEKTGGYDEKLTQSEDRELGKRVIKGGFKILLAEKALQYHKGEPQNIMDYLKRTFYIEKKRVEQGYYLRFRREVPSMNLIFLYINVLLITISLLDYRVLYLLCIVLAGFWLFIIFKIAFMEKGYSVVKLKYIYSLALYRIIRTYFVAGGYIAGKL